ncbi:sigma 54-interacting transcriptional regulator [Ignavibacteria bacterium 4148-Me]|uniref:sigma 54-interacting transcriptional regulator n=1 Tax=Rosettibacter primus TaxID=3111523 RepID=UPI00336C0EFF
MRKIQKILFYEKHTRLLAIITGLIFIILLNSLRDNLNYQVENLMRLFSGVKNTDSSIVIIHISNNDIERLGGWPLKRSYYALLINELTKFNVKKIGIEVLFSNNLAIQSIYNDLLEEELLKSGKVVLSSIITNQSKTGEFYEGDTLIYSQPKIDLPQLLSGHLNYIVKDGIYVPSEIHINSKREKAFAFQLAGENYYYKKDLVKVNFYTSWKNFKSYSLIEFFELAESDKNFSENFNDKIVIVGVSDPTVAKTMSTFYDDELPGVGFHAIVLDNILTGRMLIYQKAVFISVIFILIFIIVSQINLKKSQVKIEFIALMVYLLFSYVLFNFYFVENNYAVVMIPTLFLFLTEGLFYFIKSKIELDETSKEITALRFALKNKEQLLSELQNEKEKFQSSSDAQLIDKINKLKEEIKLLKKYSDDEEVEYTEKEMKIFEGIVYASQEMEKIVRLIEKIAPTDATVLILGESGSGKELVARAIHNLSNRRNNKFVAVNCAALSESLLESELFGHVKGAFTNAYQDKKGRFEIADGGTIFLDEIAETNENFQAKLLRVIQFGDFESVGSSVTKHTDVRIIAATNKNIDELVKQKKFREDLFYRLNVIRINIPPLRERKEDIVVLANYFVQRENDSLKISKAVMECLVRNEWKGNVRELESIIKRMAIFAKSENRTIITLKDLPEEYRNIEKFDFENIILDTLREKKFSHSSIVQTAKELGNLSRTIVSENFRGIFFKIYVNANFNLEEAVKLIAQTDDKNVQEKVMSKVSTYLENIKKDLLTIKNHNFSTIKIKLASKYKNLPVRYHSYLDEIIKYFIKELND